MFGMNCRECGRRHGDAYLTAYQIALKHGFKGTEEQWIRSIGTRRKACVTEISGNTFECDTSLGQVRLALEQGYLVDLVYNGTPAVITDEQDDYISFSTNLLRDENGDYYDVFTLSGRANTWERMRVSGSSESGGIGNKAVHLNNLDDDLAGSIALANSAVQPEALEDYVPVNVFRDIEEPSADLIEVKRDPETGRLYVLVPGRPTPTADNTRLITMNGSGSNKTASMGADAIYSLISDNTVNLVLIDVEGRECLLTGKPMPGSGRFSPAKFCTIDEAEKNIIVYSVYEQGVVSEDTIPLGEEDYGTANAGKPLVVGSDGKRTVGNWPVPGEDGEPVVWNDIVPPGGILQTDIAKLTVTFTESQQWNGYDASANLTAVLAALAANKIVDCALGDYRGELIYAHADGEDPGNEFAIFKITEQVVTYQGQDGEERLPQVRMFYMTHVGVSYQVNAIGGACYVYVTETQGVYDIDTVNTTKTAQSIQGLLTAFYAGIETRMIVVDGYHHWSHPVSFHYGQAEIRFAGPEAVTINGVTEMRVVEYSISSSSHVGRTVGSAMPVPASGEPLHPSADKGKVPKVNDYGGFELMDAGMNVPAPGNGDAGKVLKAASASSASWETVKELPDSTAADSGKYLKVNSAGAPEWGTAPSSGGSGYTGPAITVPSSADDGKLLTANADGSTSWAGQETIQLLPDQSGMVSISGDYQSLTNKLTRANPARIISATPDTTASNLEGIVMRLGWFNDSNNAVMLIGIHGPREYSVMLTQSGSASNRVMSGILGYRPIGDANATQTITPTAVNQTEYSFAMQDNRIYKVPAGNTKITITTIPSSGMAEVIFTTPATLPDGYFTKPTSMKMPDGWAGVQAGKRYDIVVSDGYALVDERTVSA